MENQDRDIALYHASRLYLKPGVPIRFQAQPVPLLYFSLLAAPPPFVRPAIRTRRTAVLRTSPASAIFPSAFLPHSPFRDRPDSQPMGSTVPVHPQPTRPPAAAFLWVRTDVPFAAISIQDCPLCRFGFPFFADFRSGVPPLVSMCGSALWPYRLRQLCFPSFMIAFCRSHHHFSVAKIVCRRERPAGLDQWRSYLNLPLSSLPVLPADKNKAY